MSVTKKKRTHKISKGLHGATQHPLTPVEKVLVGKGLMQSIRHVPLLRNWRGVGNVTSPWSPKNVAENRVLYPHLFEEN